ncbi:MAG TPA: hypothetical protein VH087_07670 [Thermoanaerobaculia bacterium]|jgi:hypothetical protein|nr:hypothetical protein [Thermoanaerobaculia bacterium]
MTSAWSILAFPSVTTVALVLLYVGRALARPVGLKPDLRSYLFPITAVTGIALYTTTIGGPSFNMYRLGFSPYAPLVLAIVAALIAARSPKIAIIVFAVIVAFDVHLYRSRNLFDYAIDPILVLVATVWSIRRVWLSRSSLRGTLRRKPTSDPASPS